MYDITSSHISTKYHRIRMKAIQDLLGILLYYHLIWLSLIILIKNQFPVIRVICTLCNQFYYKKHLPRWSFKEDIWHNNSIWRHNWWNVTSRHTRVSWQRQDSSCTLQAENGTCYLPTFFVVFPEVMKPKLRIRIYNEIKNGTFLG